MPNSKNDAGSSGSISTNELHLDYFSAFQEIISSKEFVLVVLQGASFIVSPLQVLLAVIYVTTSVRVLVATV